MKLGRLITRRLPVLQLGKRAIQRRLDAYRHWYNDLRPHAAHGAMTPAEVMAHRQPIESVTYRRRDESAPVMIVRRRHVRGDPYLFVPGIGSQRGDKAPHNVEYVEP